MENYAKWLSLDTELFRNFAGKRVLDLGTDKNARFAQDLEEAGIKTERVVSVSPAFTDEKVRSQMEKTSGMLVAAMGEALPFRDQSFDRVISAHTIEFIDSYKRYVAFLKETARVLAPGGVAYIGPIPDDFLQDEEGKYDPKKLPELEKILGPDFRVEWKIQSSYGSMPLMVIPYTLVIERISRQPGSMGANEK